MVVAKGGSVAMIWESYPWKNQLIADAASIKRWASKTQPTERRSMLIERKVFLAAYTIRKLDHSYKLSSAFHDRSLQCRTYRLKSKHITLLNNHKIDELYDLDCANAGTISAHQLMDIIIHSLVFGEVLGDDLTLKAFIVTSDRRKTRLWEIKTDAFVELMNDVGNDYPASAHWVSNPDTGELVVWQGSSGSPPPSFEERAQRILETVLKIYQPHR
jgi:hypothetical protein